MSEESLLDETFMSLALEQARIALAADEVPVGCVVVDPASNSVVAVGHNKVCPIVILYLRWSHSLID